MVKRLRRSMDIMDTMDDNTCSLAVHTVHTVHIVHSSLREQQLSTSDRLLKDRSLPSFIIAKSSYYAILKSFVFHPAKRNCITSRTTQRRHPAQWTLTRRNLIR
ncbi:MAG: hypothetical protein GX945_15495 [Lentisphaerae bacterium]|nr:hypothetical protein [Lentisphaerota bacterium]